MELDHIFIFTKEPDQVAKVLQEFGLTEGTSNIHKGQGTACRRFFFHNAYLELVWVNNEEEAKSSFISKAKLWERSQYHFTNYCPFGICFRSKNELFNPLNLLFNDGWRYYSTYLPADQFANIASNEDFPTEPMLFEMPFFGLAPKDYLLDKQQPLAHEKDFLEITKITITIPHYTINSQSMAIKKVLLSNDVVMTEGENYSVSLEFDHFKKKETRNFNPLIPLTFRW
ncbi:MAG: VOC family protein [Bacteroidota bacterium]